MEEEEGERWKKEEKKENERALSLARKNTRFLENSNRKYCPEGVGGPLLYRLPRNSEPLKCSCLGRHPEEQQRLLPGLKVEWQQVKKAPGTYHPRRAQQTPATSVEQGNTQKEQTWCARSLRDF